MHCFVSFLVWNHLEEEESLLLCYYCLTGVLLFKSSVALPHGAVGKSAVFDCGFSWSYSLTFWLYYAKRAISVRSWMFHSDTLVCGQIQGGYRGFEPPTLENHKLLYVFLEMLVLTPLRKQLDPLGLIAS